MESSKHHNTQFSILHDSDSVTEHFSLVHEVRSQQDCPFTLEHCKGIPKSPLIQKRDKKRIINVLIKWIRTSTRYTRYAQAKVQSILIRFRTCVRQDLGLWLAHPISRGEYLQ
jgi:hypothetical protein